MLSAMSCLSFRSSRRTPRRIAPTPLIVTGQEDLASTIGVAEATSRQRAEDIGDLVVIGDRAAIGADREMRVEAEDAVEQFGPEAVHHRHDDDQAWPTPSAMPSSENAAMTETNPSWRRARR